MSLTGLEFVIRAVVVYVFLFVILRITGKRQVGQLAPFDLILLLVLSNALQNSMNGGDNSITAGIILSVTLVSLNYLVAFVTFKSKRLAGIVEGKPLVLIHNGHIDEKALRSCLLTHHELNAALRGSGCSAFDKVRFAILENNGQITVVPQDIHERNQNTVPNDDNQ